MLSTRKKIAYFIVLMVIAFLLGILLIHYNSGEMEIEIGAKNLEEIIDLSCFEGMEPDMKRSEILKKYGNPDRMYVKNIEYDEGGNIKYQELCWEYRRKHGILNYYVDEYDKPNGSPEYISHNLTINDLFKISIKPKDKKKYSIKITRDGHNLIIISVNNFNKVDIISYYFK